MESRALHRHRVPTAFRTIVITLAVLTGALLLPGFAAAQTTTFPFPITKFDCEEDPGTIGQAEIPEGCVTVAGVSMTVYDGDDNVLGTCVTGAGGMCIVDLEVPDDAMVYVEEDVSTATPGYAPRENPVAVEIVMEFSEAKLVNLPEAPDLPNTGSGTGPGGTSATAFAALLGTTAFVLGLGGEVLRRLDRQPI